MPEQISDLPETDPPSQQPGGQRVAQQVPTPGRSVDPYPGSALSTARQTMLLLIGAPIRRLDSTNTSGAGVGPAVLQVVGQCRPHLGWQGEQRAVTGLAGSDRITPSRQSMSSNRSAQTSPARSPSRAMHKMIDRSRKREVTRCPATR